MDDGHALDRATVADVMHHGIVTCDVDSPLTAVARMMAAHRIHCVVVRNDAAAWAEMPGGGLWGVVSDLDLVRILVGDGILGHTAGECAATPALVVSAGDPIRRAAELMADREVTHLVVVNHAKKPVGILSTLDLARAVADPPRVGQGGIR
ncbi:MAG TPA: CBS domain-containing protein [Gaiellaceae bacterium]|jgi:CBS domain-containing protein|nr:CBS domain-containing protein [Gaiellaceae bacterium]